MTNEDRFIKTLKGVQYVVINTCYGGFGLSDEALALYKKYSGINVGHYDIARDDPILVKVVRELDTDANGGHAKLKIVEIPGDVVWQVEEYDGNEWVAEVHRTWD
jgi:hypothetical protein